MCVEKDGGMADERKKGLLLCVKTKDWGLWTVFGRMAVDEHAGRDTEAAKDNEEEASVDGNVVFVVCVLCVV